MKVTAPPPIDPGALASLGSQKLELGVRWASERRDYAHWHKFRFQEVPPGLTHEEAWILVRTLRQVRPLPMTDVDGAPFVLGSPDDLHEAVSLIDRRAAGSLRGGDAEPVAESDRDRYIVSSLEEEAIRSSQLEGAAVTRRVAREMLRVGRAPRTVDERMILNNVRAMEWIRENRDSDLSREFVCELHSILTVDTLDDRGEVGRFRRADEDIVVQVDHEVVHVPPNARELEERMAALCAFANGQDTGFFIHPIVRAILVHLWLAYDHPFVDGNGRTARGLFYWSMLRSGYWLAEYVSISRLLRKARASYGAAFLMTETDSNDATYFVLHQLDVLQRSIEDLHGYLDRKGRAFEEARRAIGLSSGLNHRQVALLERALRDAHTTFTFKGHQRSHGTSYQTARTDLLDLVDRGFFEQGKEGRKAIFWPVKGLAERIRSERERA
ncbi:MAG: Fic family protein [Planctomycetota bacterium]